MPQLRARCTVDGVCTLWRQLWRHPDKKNITTLYITFILLYILHLYYFIFYIYKYYHTHWQDFLAKTAIFGCQKKDKKKTTTRVFIFVGRVWKSGLTFIYVSELLNVVNSVTTQKQNKNEIRLFHSLLVYLLQTLPREVDSF